MPVTAPAMRVVASAGFIAHIPAPPMPRYPYRTLCGRAVTADWHVMSALSAERSPYVSASCDQCRNRAS